jgi:hypothetical protein
MKVELGTNGHSGLYPALHKQVVLPAPELEALGQLKQNVTS